MNRRKENFKIDIVINFLKPYFKAGKRHTSQTDRWTNIPDETNIMDKVWQRQQLKTDKNTNGQMDKNTKIQDKHNNLGKLIQR